ncbi:MAG: PASTA domain-containing protein [Alistipes sp.]|nr:PASTA domain-containing protein [Alistipes sp.]
MEKRKNIKRKKAAGLAGWIERLKASPVAYHAVLIALTLVVIILGSSILMSLITRHGTHRTVPDFMGVKIADAQRIADDERLEIIINDSLFVPAYEGGVVLDQLPKGGVEVKAGRKVYVTINSFREKMVAVPYVAGRSLRQAKNMLEVAGLGIEKLIYEEDIATNYVLAEIVEGKEMSKESKVEIEMGSGVVLKVGVEPDRNTTIVPKAIGQSLQTAKSRLWEQGLNVGKVNFDEGVNLLNQKDARVYRQSLNHNATTTLGATVDLWLTLDVKAVEKNSQASDKQARELEEERLKLEEALRDSLEQALKLPVR